MPDRPPSAIFSCPSPGLSLLPLDQDYFIWLSFTVVYFDYSELDQDTNYLDSRLKPPCLVCCLYWTGTRDQTKTDDTTNNGCLMSCLRVTIYSIYYYSI